jgi:YHS domain-containing protein
MMTDKTQIDVATKDPVCGMTVDEAIALGAERDGTKSYLCSEYCRKNF